MTDENYLKKLFIDEAKPALNKYEASYNAGYSDSNAEFSKFLGDQLGTYRLPDGITKIKAYALGGGWSLSTVYVPPSVSVLNNNCFSNAYRLKKVVFEGGTITNFGSTVFQSDSYLKTVEFGCELPFTSSDAFSGCSALETVTFAQEELYGNVYLHQTSKLKKECAYAAMRKLKNHIGTDTEYIRHFKLHATVWANVEDTTAEDYEAPPSGDTWQNYVISLGWNV